MIRVIFDYLMKTMLFRTICPSVLIPVLSDQRDKPKAGLRLEILYVEAHEGQQVFVVAIHDYL